MMGPQINKGIRDGKTPVEKELSGLKPRPLVLDNPSEDPDQLQLFKGDYHD